MARKPDRMFAEAVYSTASFVGMRPKLRYVKVTPGSLGIFGRLLKPGQIVIAYPEEITAAQMKHLKIIDPKEIQDLANSQEKTILEPGKEFLYRIKRQKGTAFYNVINTDTGKSINEKELTKAEAEELCDILNT